MSIKAVCFDLGGVLVRICSNWQQAITLAGVVAPEIGTNGFDERPEFSQYQAGELTDHDYLAFLADHLGGVSMDQARQAHTAILVEPYADTLQLVKDLEATGVMTGCLSNTNSLHWRQMFETDQFPAVARLQKKIASHIVKTSKPSPHIYRVFEEASGLDPHEILNFDDAQHYVDAAKRAGWQAVRIDPKGETAVQMRESMVTFGLL